MTQFSKNIAKPWEANTSTEVLLEYIKSAVEETAAAAAPPGGLATETTLQSVLTVLTDLFGENRIDFELKCIEDANGDIYLLRVTWDETAPGGYTIDYIDADGNVVVPVAPLKICSPNQLLLEIRNLLTSIDGKDFATETTLNALLTAFNAEDFATETTLTSIDTEVNKLTVAKTPTKVVSTGVTVVPIGATEISIFNNGTGAANSNGGTIPAGVEETYGFHNPIDTIITVDGLTTEQMIITYMI